MRKLIFVYFLITALIVSGFVYVPLRGKASVTYVSLGDSIARGYGLGEADDCGFVKDSYAHSFKTGLENKYKNVDAYNYATDGQNSAGLLAILTELTDEGELTEDKQLMKDNIQKADVITISIGANDILGPAQSNLPSFIIGGTDITGALTEGINNFRNNFPNVVKTLKSLNPDSKLTFLNVYNPYKEFIDANNSVSIITADKFRTIGSMAETYINAINEIIIDTISNQKHCSLIDVKTCFDNYYSSRKGNAEIINKYDVVNVSILTTEDTINLSNFANYIDPHPTKIGHDKITKLLNGWYKPY